MVALEEKLRKKKLKITPQRLEVLRALHEGPPHPSADLIYQIVKKRYPAVSLATVYKILETLVEIGEIRIALVAKGKMLFDTRLDDHHHFFCDQCGYAEDIEPFKNCLENCCPGPVKKTHRVLHHHQIFHGLCERCLAEEAARVSGSS